MRPFVEIIQFKELNQNKASEAGNRENQGKRIVLFSSKKGNAVLNERLTKFSFEESNGDDLFTTRKGRKDVLKFTFLDSTTEIPEFLTGGGNFINLRDIIRVRFGWVLDNGQEVGPTIDSPAEEKELKNSREFRVVRVEPSYSSTKSEVTITCFDRSIDLDMFAVGFMLNEVVNSDSTSSGGLPGVETLGAVLNLIAQRGGLKLDTFSSNQLAGSSFSMDIGGRFAVVNETLASYLKHLAEEFGYIYYIENRRLVFGVRTVPKGPSEFQLIRGGGSIEPTDIDDFKEFPIIDFSVEHKLTPESFKMTVENQNKRSASIELDKSTMARDSDNLILKLNTTYEMIASGATGNDIDVRLNNANLPVIDADNFLENVGSTTGGVSVSEQEVRNALNKTFNEFFAEPNSLDAAPIKSLINRPMFSSGINDISAVQELLKEQIQNLTRIQIEQFSMRDIIATVKTVGNPLLRHNRKIYLGGNLPSTFIGDWYVHTVVHEINAKDYFTTLKLMRTSPDNPFARENVTKKKKSIQQHNKPKKNKKGSGNKVAKDIPVNEIKTD